MWGYLLAGGYKAFLVLKSHLGLRASSLSTTELAVAGGPASTGLCAREERVWEGLAWGERRGRSR